MFVADPAGAGHAVTAIDAQGIAARVSGASGPAGNPSTVLNQNDVDGRNWHNNSFATTDDVIGNDGVGGFTETLDGAGAPVRILAPTVDEAAYNANHAGNPCPIEPCGVYYDSRPATVVWDAARSRALMMYELAFFEPGKDTALGRSVAL